MSCPARRCVLVLLSALALGWSAPALAEISDLWWGPSQSIDSNVSSLPPSSGTCAVAALGRWWVAYEKSGDIYCAVRDTSGGTWQIARLTTSAALQTEPHIAANDQGVYVVYEDHSGAHPEIWARRAIGGGQWDLPYCLSCDGTSSRHPVIDADPLTEGAVPYVAWEDSTASGFRVMGARFGAPAQLISSPFSNAHEPSVCDVVGGGTIAWTDDRSGVPQIYSRTEGQPERRVTNLPFPCRHADLKNGFCGDYFPGPPTILFEGVPHGDGVTEVYAAHCNNQGADMISADDGVPSTDPNVGYLQEDEWLCFATPQTRAGYFTTWTDRPADGLRHRMDEAWCCGTSISGTDLLPVTGLSHSAVGVGNASPHAGVLQLWIEDHAGAPTLMERVGRTPGCSRPGLKGPRAFLVVPGGTPPNDFLVYDQCSGQPIYSDLQWYMDSSLDQALTWDPAQQHSGSVFQEQGDVAFGVSAGGCSQAGNVWVNGCDLSQVQIVYQGAKSPDIDGNCEVDPGDLAYVQSKLGTADFCADLDGSGLVDSADVAIVRSTMWQRCSNVVASAGDPGAAVAPSLRVYPNPCHQRTTLETVSPIGRAARIDIVDAAGRRVRSIEGAAAGTRATQSWDLSDQSGRPVPAGIYFVIARFGGVSRREPLVVY